MRRTLQAPSTSGRNPLVRHPLRALVPLAALGAALALSGCETQSPIQTNVAYVATDGVPVDLGSVQLRDLVVISDGKDKPGVLSGAIINTGSTEQRVAFATDSSQPVFTTIPAHSVQQLSSPTQVQLPSVPAPGDVVRLRVESPSSPAAVVTVPVLAPQGYYSTLAPTPSSSTTTAAP
jgi:hypothetical protein